MRVLAAAAVFALGIATGHVATDVPLCWEDEVITTSGACVPLDDAEYVGGVGWVAPEGQVGNEGIRP